MKTLIVIDMQNDFIDGALGTPEAQAIVPKVKKKIEEYISRGDKVLFTRDTHYRHHYLDSLEGKNLPVEHCINGTGGWMIERSLQEFVRIYDGNVVNKYTFGYPDWKERLGWVNGPIELVGLCTDICVVSNALILKANFPETEITVDASCCAGTTPENHKAALQVMKCCQINVIGE
mgnify:CR=1 FL=1